jgi:hypothetical protein
VLSAKAIMQQSLFTNGLATPDLVTANPAEGRVQNGEARWHMAIGIALAVAVVAFLLSLLAIVLAYLR